MSAHVVERERYRLELADDGLLARVFAPTGEHLLSLRPLAALDTLDGLDETVAVEPPRRVGDGRFEVERRSTRWERAVATLACGEDAIELAFSVAGSGRLADAHLLAARLPPRGFLPSASSLETLFSPAPEDPARIFRSARETVAIGVTADSEPGRGRWFFTPAPLYFALAADESAREWVTIGLAAPVEELTFTELVHAGADRAFSLRLAYEGHTEVADEFRPPAVVVTPGLSDPYAGLRAHREDLVRRGVSPAPRPRDEPAWWREPSFCGWGAQCALARGSDPKEQSTQTNYDAFLSHLERNGVVPGVVVVDDKWQEHYGTCRPDARKWPSLREWIAARRERGQHVLLWWKAWDAEGLSPDLCVRDSAVLDPTNPRARAVLQDAVRRMLARDGLDADGLKVDFTASTPTGAALTAHGRAWGIALLHELLDVVYDAAKEAKPDALVITHAPHPSFVDVADMIRLNDMLRLADAGPAPAVVPQMRYRAEVVRSTCPELLVDTDDWCAPDLEQWRAYLEEKPYLGVPSLYYAQSLDRTGQPLEPRDYEALSRTWEQWRATLR